MMLTDVAGVVVVGIHLLSMEVFNHDVKSIIYRYLYDVVVKHITKYIPIITSKMRGASLLKKGSLTSMVRTYIISSSSTQDKIVFWQDDIFMPRTNFQYIRISIIDGAVYEYISISCKLSKLKKLFVMDEDETCCWQQIVRYSLL